MSIALVAMVLATTRTALPASAAQSRDRPNIVFVLTDDLDVDAMQYLPTVRSLIGDAGATFDNQFVNVSLCCPSRATTFRGQYAHNTGVQTNGNFGTNGGYQAFLSGNLEADTVATRLQDAGYSTALIGKYMNQYPAGSPTRVPVGWDFWASAVDGDPYRQYGYSVNENGSIRAYGSAASDYGTSVYLALAQRFVVDHAARDPFFLYLSLYPPHDPATPAPEDVGRFAGSAAPRGESFDQADVTGMPQYIRDLPRFTPTVLTQIDALYRHRIESLQGVDRAVAALVDTLRQNGQLDNTYFVFTSDNGFHLGQHRLPGGKQTAYDTDTHVPLMVRGPRVRPGSHVRELTGNVDLAPTFLAMAGARAPRYVDGRSLMPLLHDRSTKVHRDWRQVSLVQHWQERGTRALTTTTARGLLEPPDLDERTSRTASGTTAVPVNLDVPEIVPDLAALRTDTYLYVENGTGERELYDVRTDPGQVHNLIAEAASAAVAAELSQRLQAMRTCAAQTCRRIEARPLR